jgi:Family of unknown function (DUF6713)
MNMKNLIFYLSLGTFSTHELDAMINHEWRVLPLTSWLPDETGVMVFLFSHIPLFAVVFALVASMNEKTRTCSRLVISGFLVLHGVLHTLFIGDKAYEFASSYSRILIFGGAVLGLVYIVLEFVERRATST